jgi:hypothetical protein
MRVRARLDTLRPLVTRLIDERPQHSSTPPLDAEGLVASIGQAGRVPERAAGEHAGAQGFPAHVVVHSARGCRDLLPRSLLTTRP